MKRVANIHRIRIRAVLALLALLFPIALLPAISAGWQAIREIPPPAPKGGPYTHRILSASSRDGLNWTRDEGVRLDHASVPCPLADGDRWKREKGIRLTADAGESITDPCVIRWKNGYKMYFKAQGNNARNVGPAQGNPAPFDAAARPDCRQPGPRLRLFLHAPKKNHSQNIKGIMQTSGIFDGILLRVRGK